MRILLWIALWFAMSVTLRADVVIDDTYERVVAAKGQPTGRMEAGDTTILR